MQEGFKKKNPGQVSEQRLQEGFENNIFMKNFRTENSGKVSEQRI